MTDFKVEGSDLWALTESFAVNQDKRCFRNAVMNTWKTFLKIFHTDHRHWQKVAKGTK